MLSKLDMMQWWRSNESTHLPLMRPRARFSKVPKPFRARKPICEIVNRLFWKAYLLTCFQGNKKKTYCEVWRIKCSPFLSYKGNCDTRKWPVQFLHFCETGPRVLFLRSPETSVDNFRCIFTTKASRGTKLCSYFNCFSLYNIWKEQQSFTNGFSGLKCFWDFRETGN